MKPHLRLHILLGVLSILLLGSLGANYFLYRQGQEYYLQLNLLRLDPLGLNYYQDPPQARPDLPLVVFLGDSRATSWPAPDLDRFAFVNRGIGAQTSVQVLGRFDDHVKPLKPNILILQAGINDLKTIPLFPGGRQAIVARCQESIRQIVAKSIDLGATVILTTIFPEGQVPIERRPFWSGDVGVAIDEVNSYIRSLAGNKVIVLDAYSVLSDGHGSLNPEYSQDLLHLTPQGYKRLNAELVPILEKLE